MTEIGKGQYRLHIEGLIRDEMRMDKAQYSEKERCYHPHYDGAHAYKARGMQKVLDYLLENGVIS